MGAGESRVCGGVDVTGAEKEDESVFASFPNPFAAGQDEGAAGAQPDLKPAQRRRAVEHEVGELKPLYRRLFRQYAKEEEGALSRREFRLFYRDALMAAGHDKEEADELATSPYQGVEKAAAVFQSIDILYAGKVTFAQVWAHPHSHAALMPRTHAAVAACRKYFAEWKPRPVSKVRRQHVTARQPREKFADTPEGRRAAEARAAAAGRGAKKKKKKRGGGKAKKAYPKTPRWGNIGAALEAGGGMPSAVDGQPHDGAAGPSPLDWSRWSAGFKPRPPQQQAGGSAAILPERRPRTQSDRLDASPRRAPAAAARKSRSRAASHQPVPSFHRGPSAYGPDRVAYMKSIPVGGALSASSSLDSDLAAASGGEGGRGRVGSRPASQQLPAPGSQRDRQPPRRAVNRYITPGGPAFPYDGADERQLREDTRKALAESMRIRSSQKELRDRSLHASGGLAAGAAPLPPPPPPPPQAEVERKSAPAPGGGVRDSDEEELLQLPDDEEEEDNDRSGVGNADASKYDDAAAALAAAAYEYEEDRDVDDSDY